MTLTAVIVDDHAGFRTMARQMLEDAGFEVVGEAADGAAALATVMTLRPRLLLLDIELPDKDGFTVARDMAEAPGTVVVLTSVRTAADFGERRATSARRFIPKAELSGAALNELFPPTP